MLKEYGVLFFTFSKINKIYKYNNSAHQVHTLQKTYLTKSDPVDQTTNVLKIECYKSTYNEQPLSCSVRNMTVSVRGGGGGTEE